MLLMSLHFPILKAKNCKYSDKLFEVMNTGYRDMKGDLSPDMLAQFAEV